MIAAAVLWAVLVAVAYAAGRFTSLDSSVCLFKRVSGYPCATCGGTRAAVRLLHFDVTQAFALNPLVTTLLLGLPVYVLWRTTLGRSWAGPSSRAYRAMPWIIFMVVVANWAYVLMHA